MRCRILTGDSFDPWHNLAVEALLFEALGPDEAVLFLWQNRNTVVVGRHQNAWKECRVRLLEAEGGRLARRSSGGGAVYHDLGNLNFSFVVSRAGYDVRRQLGVVQAALGRFGIESAFTGRNDLVTADGAKFSGSAYRFSRSTGLHHGTLLVDVDLDRLDRYLAPGPDKLRAKGIESVRARVRNLKELCPALTVSALADALRAAFADEYGPCEPMAAADLDPCRLAALEAEYASWDFRLGKALPFDAALEHRFPWGGVALSMRLQGGTVTAAEVCSDAMDEAMIGRIAPALAGVRYENAALAEALRALHTEQAEELAAWLTGAEL